MQITVKTLYTNGLTYNKLNVNYINNKIITTNKNGFHDKTTYTIVWRLIIFS